MEILQLKYFCDAAETENFSKTAKKYLVPPSNISQSIKRLEAELNTTLFDRKSNKINLNDSGLFFYKNAKSALDLLENAKKSLKNSQKTETIKINILITRRIVMEAIEDFRKLYPDVHFITVHNADTTTNKFDIIVTDKNLNLPYLKTHAAEENILLAYNKNLFKITDSADFYNLESLPFITMGIGNSTHEQTVNICNRLGFSPNIVLQSEDPFYIRKCIELGLGVSFVPELSWRGQFSDNITLKSIGDYKRTINIYKKYGMSEVLDEFYNMLLEKFSR